MDNNVMDFNEALKRVKEQENQEKGHCDHCELKSELVSEFLATFQEIIMNNKGKSLNEFVWDFVGDFYDEVYEEGKKEAYSDILGYAGYSIDQIDGIED